MADEGINVSSLSGNNIITKDGLLEAIGVDNFDDLLSTHSTSTISRTQIQVTLSIEAFGEQNDVILALTKEGDSVTLLNSANKSISKVFEKSVPNMP